MITNILKFCVTITLTVFLTSYGFTQDHSLKTATAVYTTETITPDGKLSEPAWQTAHELGSFTQVEPGHGKPSAYKTAVKILYNENAVYIAFSCYYPPGDKLKITTLERDFNWPDNDFCGIALDAFHDKRNAAVFGTNPYGAQFDELAFDDQLFDLNWNGLWTVGTKITPDCWTAEFEIPWKTLRYHGSVKEVQTWGVNFIRLQRSSNELSAWSVYPREFTFTRMEFAGQLDSLKPPVVKGNVEVTPYVLLNHTTAATPQPGGKNVREGGDLKWAVDPNTILDVTANPDFAQAEADVQVSNTSRYSVYFPEKRAFFLENASLFGSGLNLSGSDAGGNLKLQAYNSRNMGLDSTGLPVTIQGGFRLVHRSLENNYGIIAVRQQDGNGNLSYLGTSRYAYNFGGQNRIGTSMNINDQNTGNGTHLNLVNTVDGFFRFGKAHSLNFMLLNSYTNDNRRNGAAGYAQYYYSTPQLLAWFTGAFITKDYNNELGFQSRQNIIFGSTGYFLTYRDLRWVPLIHPLLRDFDPSFAADINLDAVTGKVTDGEIRLYPLFFNFNSGAYLGTELIPSYENIGSVFSPLNIAIGPGQYRYLSKRIYFASNAAAKISTVVSYQNGGYYNGSLDIYSASLRVNPLPNAAVTGSLVINDAKKLGVDQISRKVSLFTLDNRFALNTKLLLSGLVQASTQDHTIGYNFRLSWEYRPLSYLYIVFNKLQPDATAYSAVRFEQAIIKLSWLCQF